MDESEIYVFEVRDGRETLDVDAIVATPSASSCVDHCLNAAKVYAKVQVFLGKSTHAQTVITRPVTEGCGLEARLHSK